MRPFDYVSVVLSVIIGLGLTHLLTGFVELVQARDRVRFYWLHTTWAALLFVGIVYLWWSIWGPRALPVWNFGSFLVLLLEAVLLFVFVAAAFLVPRPTDPPLDLRAHYYQSRRGVFGAYAAFVVLLMIHNGLLGGSLWTSANAYLLIAVAVTGGAMVTERGWYHAAAVMVLIVWLAMFIVTFGLRIRA